MDYSDVFRNNEGKGIPYRGRCDDINRIVKVLSPHIFKKDEKLNKMLIDELSCYKFIHKISINGDECTIEYDEGSISFSTVPNSYFSKFNKKLFYDEKTDRYNLYRECHYASIKYLKWFSKSNISAVTSLCVSVNNLLFFHSYIWDKDTNNIIDLSKNIIMNKNDYDKLFCYKEINVLDYEQYKSLMDKTDYFFEKNKYCELLYLALVSLSHEESEKERVQQKKSSVFQKIKRKFS